MPYMWSSALWEKLQQFVPTGYIECLHLLVDKGLCEVEKSLYIKGGMQTKGIFKQDHEANIWI